MPAYRASASANAAMISRWASNLRAPMCCPTPMPSTLPWPSWPACWVAAIRCARPGGTNTSPPAARPTRGPLSTGHASAAWQALRDACWRRADQGIIMLKIWGRPSSVNVQKVLWTVRELALPHTNTHVGGQLGGLDTPEYGKLNPNRKGPVIDSGGLVLWESNAIVRYLAARYNEGGLWPSDVAVRAQADRWMDWTATEWQLAMVPAFLGLIRTPEAQRNAAAIEASTQKANQLGLILEDALQEIGRAHV